MRTNYIAEHIDPEKFEEALDKNRRFQQEELRLQVEKANAFFAGYEKALEDVRSMLHCCNYESKDRITQSFRSGADTAFYELCKELDIGSQDIRDMMTGIDEKASLLAERIRNVFGKPDNTD